MTKKHLIALADALRSVRPVGRTVAGFAAQDQWVETIEALADFCQRQNPAFKRDRWIGYIHGTNGQNGGAK